MSALPPPKKVVLAYSGGLDTSIILFGVRSLAAALFAIAHLRWLKAALDQLQAEGRLKDPQ